MSVTCRYDILGAAVAALLAGALPAAAHASDFDFDPDSGLTWHMGDGKNAPSLTLDGRFHGDYAQYDPDVTPLDDGALLRRLRPALTLEWGDWKAKVDYEFNDRSQGVHTAYVEYDGFKRSVLRVGAQPIAFGLEASGSSNTNPFMERSLASSALAPGSMAGVSFRKWSSRWNFMAGAYGNDINDDEQRGLDGYGVVGRATGVPFKSDAARVHVGVSLEYRNADSSAELRYRTRPESNVDGTRLVDTGAIAGINKLGTEAVELAWQYRSLLLGGEYVMSQAERDAGTSLAFSGWQVTGSWFATGERRRYSEAAGSFGGVKPNHKWGAVELKARASSVDLDDGDVTGGKERNEAVGINWWYSQNIRVLAEYVMVHTDPGRNGIAEDPSVLQARVQIAF
jgi:phosphate-selective porin OprO/OprP